MSLAMQADVALLRARTDALEAQVRALHSAIQDALKVIDTLRGASTLSLRKVKPAVPDLAEVI